MATIPGQRFQSGDICEEGGWYEFDGYVDGLFEPLPVLEELAVLLAAGSEFPRIQSSNRGCYWRPSENPGQSDAAAAALTGSDG